MDGRLWALAKPPRRRAMLAAPTHLVEGAGVTYEVRHHGAEKSLGPLVGRDVVQPNVHHERVVLMEPNDKVVVAD